MSTPQPSTTSMDVVAERDGKGCCESPCEGVDGLDPGRCSWAPPPDVRNGYVGMGQHQVARGGSQQRDESMGLPVPRRGDDDPDARASVMGCSSTLRVEQAWCPCGYF